MNRTRLGMHFGVQSKRVDNLKIAQSPSMVNFHKDWSCYVEYINDPSV